MWPTPEQELLLRVALCPPAVLGDGWPSAARLAVEIVDRDPGSARLAPLLWVALARHGEPSAAHAALRSAYERTLQANRTLLGHAARVIDAMHEAGVPTLLLKGPALVARYYVDPGLRPMDDVDIVVPVGAVSAATDVLGRLGWRPEQSLGAAVLSSLHAVTFTAEGRPPCDLHWHVMPEFRQPGDDDDFWAASTPLAIEGTSTRALAPADQLLHACLQADAWVHTPKIRWVADAVFITAQADVDWTRVLRRAASHRLSVRLERQLGYLRATYDARIPPEILDALRRCGGSAFEHVELALRARAWRNMVPFHAMNALRASGRRWHRAPLAALRALQALWALDSPGHVPRELLRRLRRRLRWI